MPTGPLAFLRLYWVQVASGVRVLLAAGVLTVGIVLHLTLVVIIGAVALGLALLQAAYSLRRGPR